MTTTKEKEAIDYAIDWAKSIGATACLERLDVKVQRAPWPASKATIEQRLAEARSRAEFYVATSLVLADLALHAPPEAVQAAARLFVDGCTPAEMLIAASFEAWDLEKARLDAQSVKS